MKRRKQGSWCCAVVAGWGWRRKRSCLKIHKWASTVFALLGVWLELGQIFKILWQSGSILSGSELGQHMQPAEARLPDHFKAVWSWLERKVERLSYSPCRVPFPWVSSLPD